MTGPLPNRPSVAPMNRALLCLLLATCGACATQPEPAPRPDVEASSADMNPHDPERAARDFALGLEHYEAFRYREAALAFRSAELMHSENPEIRHHRLLAELLSGERAAEFVHPVEILPRGD